MTFSGDDLLCCLGQWGTGQGHENAVESLRNTKSSSLCFF